MNLPPRCLALAVTLPLLVHAQNPQSFPLWPGGAPDARGQADQDIPTLTVYLPAPEHATGAAMVVCPGGGYAGLADHEGSIYARWLNDLGITSFVLKYRLGPNGYHHPAMWHDAARALRTVRARAAEWRVDPHRVGIIGSSAGGHLASTTMTHWDAGHPDATSAIERQSSRPDLAILCYPVVSMSNEFTHKGSRNNLLGTNPPAALLRELSAELHVNKDTPPCFLWSTLEDKTVPVENTLLLAQALRRAGVPFDLHVYERGPHGIGLGVRTYSPGVKLHPWAEDCRFWLREHQFVR